MAKSTDLKQHALALLDMSKRFLFEDSDLDPIALIITPNEQLLRPLELQNEVEKLECCKKIVDEARTQRALAIVTIFLARMKDFEQQNFSSDTYSWGNIQGFSDERCILITISGPGIRNWAAMLPFMDRDAKIVFGEIVEFSEGVDLGLFPGWSDQVTSPRVS
jgi:hypothetical protein